MKIGLIIFSHTGHTKLVTEKLSNFLKSAGHDVDFYHLEIKGGYDPQKPQPNTMDFESFPNLEAYDGLVFGAPVHAFSLCLPMKKCFEKIQSLKNKKVGLLVTQHLSFAWLGGNRAVNWMRKQCQTKGAEVIDSGIIGWKRKDREELIQDIIKRFGQAFGNYQA